MPAWAAAAASAGAWSVGTNDAAAATAEPHKKNCAGAAKSSSFERQETARYSPEYFDVLMIEWINSVEDPSAFASKSQLAPNYSSLHHNVEMEQLNLSDAIDLHPEITVNTSCQRMETVDQEKGTAAPSIKDDRLWSWRFSFSWIDSTWLSRLAGIELNFEKKTEPTGWNRFEMAQPTGSCTRGAVQPSSSAIVQNSNSFFWSWGRPPILLCPFWIPIPSSNLKSSSIFIFGVYFF
jgi:hypothetical protein